MAVINVTKYIQGEDIYTTMGDTGLEATKDFNTYVFPNDQDLIRVINKGSLNLLLVCGNYTSTVIRPGNSFEGKTSFTEFSIKAIKAGDEDEVEFDFLVKDFGDTDVDISKWFEVAKRRAAGTSDLKLVPSANKTTSASTINSGITNNGNHEVEFTITLKNDAGSTTHEWFNGNFEVAVDVTSTKGIATTNVPVLTMFEGVGKIKLVYTGVWAKSDVIKLGIKGRDILGYPVTGIEPKDTLS